MKITKQKLKQIIKEELQEAIGSHGNAVQHLHKLVSTNAYSNLNQMAAYLANNVFAANVQQDREGFMNALRKAVPQLKELQGELNQAATEYAQSLRGVSTKWQGVLESINASLEGGEQAADAAANPLAAAKDRMRQAYANREQDPEEYKAAQQAYRAARGR
jgi:phenylalanyl-tRNA synthetase alpha subunit